MTHSTNGHGARTKDSHCWIRNKCTTGQADRQPGTDKPMDRDKKHTDKTDKQIGKLADTQAGRWRHRPEHRQNFTSRGAPGWM